MCSDISVNSPGNPWSQSWRRRKKLLCEGFAEQEDFKPGMNKYRVIDTEIEIGVSMERIEEAP